MTVRLLEFVRDDVGLVSRLATTYEAVLCGRIGGHDKT